MAEIPDKLYFKIGEVAEIVGVKPHVLRYWESEFKALKPAKSQGNQRLYRKPQIEQLLQLKDLLHRQGYTLAGAKKQLKSSSKSSTEKPPHVEEPVEMSLFPQEKPVSSGLVDEIRQDLKRLRQSLS